MRELFFCKSMFCVLRIAPLKKKVCMAVTIQRNSHNKGNIYHNTY